MLWLRCIFIPTLFYMIDHHSKHKFSSAIMKSYCVVVFRIILTEVSINDNIENEDRIALNSGSHLFVMISRWVIWVYINFVSQMCLRLLIWFSGSTVLMVKRDGNGRVVKEDGFSGLMLVYLASSLNFTYILTNFKFLIEIKFHLEISVNKTWVNSDVVRTVFLVWITL